MEIAIIITSGVVIITLLSAGFDYLSKRSKKVDTKNLEEMEKRISALENKISDRDEKILELEDKIDFFHKLLDRK